MTDRMTPEQLAARWLADVPRHYDANAERVILEADVLAAIARHLATGDDLVAQATAALEGVTEGPWAADVTDPSDVVVWGQETQAGDDYLIGNVGSTRVQNVAVIFDVDAANARFIAWCREGVPALLAQNAALRAQIAEKERTYDDLYADALADAKSDAQDFDSDLWIEVRKFLTELHLDWRDYAYDGITAEQAIEYIRECMDEETRRAEAAAQLVLTLQSECEELHTALAAMTKERDEWRKLESAAQGLSEVLDQHKTKGPIPDTALMFCWLAAQNVRAVLRGYMLEKTE